MPARMTVEEFIADFSQARRSTSPVFVTDNGREEGVYMSYQAYRRLTAGHRTLAETIGQSDAADIDLELPERGLGTHRDVAF